MYKYFISILQRRKARLQYLSTVTEWESSRESDLTHSFLTQQDLKRYAPENHLVLKCTLEWSGMYHLPNISRLIMALWLYSQLHY